MQKLSFFKTIFLFLNILGVCAVCALGWKNFDKKKNTLLITKKIVSETAQKWDKQTGKTFVEQNLKLNVNVFQLEVVVANLAQHDTTKYLTAYPVIKFVTGRLNKSDYERVLPKIREVIIDVINQKSAVEILEENGISKLKEDLLRELNKLNLPLEIEKIYFTSIIVA
ncbi:MAG: flagellar basal body-associated FliL family protein [Bacteriovoracales bacterium]